MPVLRYVLQAHAKPRQLRRQVEALWHVDDEFLVHIDLKVDERPFRRELSGLVARGNVHFQCKRHRCIWGGFGIVASTIDAMQSAAHDGAYSHLITLTGQDYPIKPLHVIRNTLLSNQRTTFMSFADATKPQSCNENSSGDGSWDWDGNLERIDRRYFMIPAPFTKVSARKWITLPNRKIPFPPLRKLPQGISPYQGLAYFCMSSEAVAWVLRVFDERPDIPRFFRRCLVPDEYIFQTVLKSTGYPGRLCNDDLRFIRWSGWHPRVLVLSDLPSLEGSRKLFGRKFDEDVDSDILDRLDRVVREAPSS